MLASLWQNPARPLDVNNDGIATPLDALLVLNQLRRTGTSQLPDRTNRLDWYYDTNGDNEQTPLDALVVLTGISRGGDQFIDYFTRVEGATEIAPAGFISRSLVTLPGNSDQLVDIFTSLTVEQTEFNELGLFVTDHPDGTINGIHPSSAAYPDAVFQSDKRRVLYSKRGIFRETSNAVFPAGQNVHLYVLQAASANGDTDSHLHVRDLGNSEFQTDWAEQPPVSAGTSVGELSHVDAVVNIAIGEPYGGNAPPIIHFIHDRIINELTELAIQPVVMDPNLPNEMLTYTLDVAPAGAVIDAQIGLFRWTPTEAQGPGVYPVTIRVTDQQGAVDIESFQVTVREVNSPPVMEPIDDATVLAGDNVVFMVHASDPDSPANVLTFSLDVGAPLGASIDHATGLFTWQAPAVDTVTTFLLTARVRDDKFPNLTAADSFMITVKPSQPSCAFDDELTGWNVFANGESTQGEGTVTVDNCAAVITEGSSLRTELSRQLTLASDGQGLKLRFDSPQFDTTATGTMPDAFEIAVSDLNGNMLTQPFAPQRTAVFNWSESSDPAAGSEAVLTLAEDGNGGPHELLINLSHFPAGTQVIVTARLINNDSDNHTSVVIRGLEVVDGLADPSTVFASSPSRVDTKPITQWERLEDLTGSIEPSYGSTSYTADRSQIISELVVTNLGSHTVNGELVVVLDRLSDIETFVMYPDGILPDGRPYFNLTDFVDGALTPGQSTRPREIRFTNPGEQRFDYRLTTLGYLNAAPGAFITTPIGEIEAGRTFRYAAEATDDDGHELSYAIVSGPAAMTIDAATGEVIWATTIDDVARHSVILRATDPFGLFVEQSFAIDVVATLQNRPPVFVSDPVTDAIASSGFEISTVAVGPLPSGVDVISGFRGPRLVSINAGDQTVSVHAGQNNDRFDDRTVFSTGEPRPTGMAIDVGYSVDVGLPPFLVPSDSNDVLGMDHGDFNGDGILDLVVLTKRTETTKPQGQRDTIEITRMLGDGDGNFSPPVVIATIPFASNSQSKHLRVADIDGDGHLDVVAIEETSSRLITVRGIGNGDFQPPVLTTISTALNDFRLFDLDSDGHLDIVGRNGNLTDLGWMQGSGDGTFEAFVRLADGGGITVGASDFNIRPYDFADLNGDGHVDIVHGEYNSGNVLILLNDGSQNFTNELTIDPPGGNAGPMVVHVADFTGDGALDIFTINHWQSRVDLFVGDGTGTGVTHQPGTGLLNWAGNAAGSDRPVDINGDGHLDIVLTNAGSGEPTSPQVLLNDGQGNFTRTDYPMLSFSGHATEHNQANFDIARGAMFGDYNGDGVMDLIYMTAGNDFNGVGIRLGTRPGEFGATGTVANATQDSGDTEVHAADFNGDGIVDLLVLRSATMMLGNGDGTFAEPFPAAQVARPGAFGAVADFNLDALPDYVAVRNANQSPAARFYVAIANGDGTFEVSDDQPAPGSFYGYSDIRVADFNNDGYPDMIAKAGVERFIDVYLNDPDDPGTFSQSFRTVIQAQGNNARGFTNAFAAGDFDGDGNVDFVAVDQEPGEPLKLVMYSGDGAGNFAVTNESFAFDDSMFQVGFYYPGVLQSGDVNGDGILDIVSFGWQGAIVHIGNGDGTFTSIDHYPRESFNSEAVDSYLIDFDEDGHLDLVQYGRQETLSIRRGLGDGTFGEPERVGMIGAGSPITFADLDHDGHLDMAMVMAFANNYRNEDVVLYFGTRDGLVDQVAADLNGDGNEEILSINEANDRLKLFVGDNLGGLTRQADLFTGRAPKAVTVGDLNGDGQLEIITANRAGRSISVFTGSITTGYDSIEIPVGSGPIDVSTADVNGDGHLDVLVLDDSANALWILAGSEDATLADPVAIALGDKPGRFTITDATGDGQLNAVITLPESNRVMILSGLDLQPGAAPPIFISFESSPSDVVVTDLNFDGNPDVAVTLPQENVLSVLYGRGLGQFARPQRISVGEEPTRVTSADADEDGRMDLIVANRGDETASVIYNRFDPNEVYRYASEAIDPDDDPIVYSIVDGPGGLIINSETGALLWAASPDQVGIHDVTIAADDGRGGIATQSFKIDVQPARDNAAPLFATEPQTRIGAGEPFAYQAKALDNDRDPLRFRLLEGPTGAAIDPTTGEVTWDARPDLAVSFAPHGNSSTGRIEIAADPSLQPASLTVEAWYNFTSATASNGRSSLIVQPNSGSGFAYSLYNLFNNQLRLQMDFGGATPSHIYSVPFVPQTDRWYHIALTIDDNNRTATIFADGVPLGTTVIPQAIVYNPDARAQIGDSGAFYTRAIVDNYRLWNVARTPAEIIEGMSRQYENDSRVVLDYRFDLPNTLTVRDYSPAGNHGYRIANGLLPPLVPGLANPGSHDFTIGVEDGRGGFDTQSFTVEVLAELRGSIRGLLFDDPNGDGVKDTDEPVLSDWHLFIDINGNGFADPHEQQTTTDALGNYRFDGLLPGDYPVRVTSVAGYETPSVQNISVTANAATVHDLAIEQLALSHIRGQLRMADEVVVPHWRVFADLDDNGSLDENEPTAISDRNGHYALTGLAAGEYRIRTELPAGWADTTGREGLLVTLAADQIAADNDFVLTATNTSVTGGLNFVTIPTSIVEARQTFRYAAIAMSIVDEPIVYDLSLAPAGMTVDPDTGLLAWRPTIAQVGEHLVVLRATNESGSIALHDFYVEVTTPNTAPHLSVDPPVVAYVGLTYAVDLVAQDAEMHTVSFSLLEGPVEATLDAATGRLRWTPTASDIGTESFSIELRDELGTATVVDFTVDVVDSQPAITPLDITFPRTQVGLGQDYVSHIRGTDALGRPLTWSLVSGPTGMSVSQSGNLTWTPSHADLGEHAVQLHAADVDGGIEEVAYVLFVVGRPVISGPIIVSSPMVSAVIDRDYRYDVRFDDADSDIVAFELLDSPAGMSIHPSLGTVHWIPTLDQLGERTVTIQVSDPDGRTDSQSYTLKVSRFGGPPLISSIPPTHASVGVGYLYSVAARDAERDPLTYRLLAAPVGMTIVEVTGEIAWTPTTDQIGQQEIVIEVSDGVGGAVTQAFAIRVSEGVPNSPPQITTSAPRFGAVGTTYGYQVQAIDPEATELIYELGQAPAGMTIDASTGQVTWTPASDQAGKHVVTLRVTDAGGAAAIESFELDVLAENQPPLITGTAPVEVPAGATFRYDVRATDADLDQLRFVLLEAPDGATIDTFGRINWKTSLADLGSHLFEVVVFDSRGGQATQSFSLAVVEDTEGPRVSLIVSPNSQSRNVLPWQGPFRVYVRAIDNVEVAAVTLQANGRDIPLDAAGTATFSFEDWTFSTIVATATGIDIYGNTTTKTIDFKYAFPEGWSGQGLENVPQAVITSPADTAAVTGMVTITGTAAHDDFAAYKLSYRHVDETQFIEFHVSETPVESGELGVWDTSLLINDEYVIRLEVATTGGVVNVVEHNVGLGGELKLGNFRLSFTDMVIPVAGIPIEITRIYDTLQADREGDFGYGWRLEYRNTDLRVGLPKSGLEDIGIYSALRPGVKVFLNVPGQGRQGFTFNPDIRVLPGFGGNNLVLARPRFSPDPGVTSTLSTGTSSYLQVNEQGELYAPGGIPYNPASPNFGGAYVLTTRDGFTYRIDGSSGKLVTASDRNGNVLQFSESRITTRDEGSAITFKRDAENRITHVLDPNGHSVSYAYSSVGDLISVVDREGNTTTLKYSAAPSHYLEDVVNALGNSGIRTEYDEQGRLINLFDANSNSTTFTSEPENFITSITDVNGNQFTVEYDLRGNVVTQVDARGAITRRTFDARNNLTSVTDPLGFTTSYTYDAVGNLTAIVDSLGHRQIYTYGPYGAVVDEIDEQGFLTRNELDANGNILSSKNSLGALARYTYDNFGNMVSFTDAQGNATTYAYDAIGNLIEEMNPLGVVTRYVYDAAGNKLSETTTQTTMVGVVDVMTSWTYDRNGRPSEMINALGNTTRTEYNELGLESAFIDSNGNRTEYEYDSRGLLISIVYADGTLIQNVYDDNSQVVATIDQLGRLTRYVLDVVGNVVETILPDNTPDDDTDNPRTKTEFDLIGRRVAEVDELGNRTNITYDSVGRARSITFPDATTQDASDNLRTEHRYDARGNLTLRDEPTTGTTQFEYDAVGNQITTRHMDGTSTREEFDSLKRRIARVDQNDISTLYEYDSLGRITAVLQSLDREDQPSTRYQYDEQGNLITQTDPNGHSTQYQYDLLSRRIGTTMAMGQQSSTAYDAFGNVVASTNFNGETINFTYDSMNRVTRRDLPDGTSFAFAYTSNGYTQSIHDARGTTVYVYDDRDRLLSRTEPDGAAISYTYDFAGREISQTTLAGTVVKSYNAIGNLVAVIGPNGEITSYVYDNRGRPVEIHYPNGISDVYTLDDLSRVLSVETKGEAGVLRAIDYSLDATGRRIATVESSGRVVKYEYDNLYRLTSELIQDPAIGVRSIEYKYDMLGNRLSRLDSVEGLTTYMYDANDRLLQKDFHGNTTTYTYDANGNTLGEYVDSDNEKVYRWNAENRLVNTIIVLNGQVAEANYMYDAEGLRVGSKIGLESTGFLLDKNTRYAQVIVEYSPSGGIQGNYVYGNQLISMARDGSQAFYHADAVGTVRLMTDINGVIVNEYDYDSFGRVLEQRANFQNQFLYAGEYRDSFLGWDFLRARYLDTQSGRFLTRDTFDGILDSPLTLQRYSYAHNDPVNNTDPSGNITLKEVLLVTTGSIGFFAGGAYGFYSAITTTSSYAGGYRDASDGRITSWWGVAKETGKYAAAGTAVGLLVGYGAYGILSYTGLAATFEAGGLGTVGFINGLEVVYVSEATAALLMKEGFYLSIRAGAPVPAALLKHLLGKNL